MKPRSLILILLISGAPSALLVWAAVRIAADEQIVVQQQFSGLMEQRLQDVRQNVHRYFQRVEAELQKITSLDDPEITNLRHLGRTEPLVMQMFVLTAEGRLRYPDPAQTLNSDEKSFLLRTSKIFTDLHLTAPTVDAVTSNTLAVPRHSEFRQKIVTADTASTNEGSRMNAESGWFVWYWDRGLNLIYWQLRPSGRIIGTALDRSRWIADLIGQLPDGPPRTVDSEENYVQPRIRLVNAASETVYQWGPGTDAATEVAAEIALAEPLSSWRLQSLVAPEQLPGESSGSLFGLVGGLLAVGVAVCVLAFVLVRDYTRDMWEAERQVSFVNQVSHELKTPLTNIRLYAEMLEEDLEQLSPDCREQPRRRLDVILSEGQRLTRLIGNVLTFARQKRDSLELKRKTGIPDDVIRQVLKHFQPALERLGIRIHTELHAGQTCRLDTDCLEQILGNLISNVEKYAAESDRLVIRSRLENDLLTMVVADDGPGIGVRDRDRVFQPFVRLSRDITSAAGTGIGLSIVQELAWLHGGDVRLLDHFSGCRFEVTLRVNRA